MTEHREDQSAGDGRPLELVEIKPGPAAVETFLPRLADACAGNGPALAIASFGTDEYADRVRRAVGYESGITTVDSDVALVVSTSGSLGQPKGVLLSAEALLSSAHAAHEFLGSPGSWLLAVPISSIGGIQVLLRSLVAQTDPVALSSVGGASSFDPAEFAQKAWTLDPSLPAYCSLVPTQISRICDSPEGLAALQGFDAVLIGGARLPAVLAQRLDDAHVRWYSTYGMTETCGGLFYNGLALPGAGATIADPDSHGVGRIVLHGPMVASGYFNNSAATTTSFVDGAHITADLGTLSSGRLEVIGRIDDVVQVGGINVSLSAVEEVLRRHYLDVAVLADSDVAWGSTLTAYVVASAAPESDDHLHDIDSILGRPARPQRLVRVDQIPYSANGKVDRDALRQIGEGR